MHGFWESSLFDVIVALVVPIGWGVLSAWVFDLVRARLERRAAQSRSDEPKR